VFLAARTKAGQYAGAYKGTILFTATGELIPCQYDGSISYDDVGCVEPITPTTMQQMTQAYCTNDMEIYNGTATNPDEIDKLLTLTDTRNGQAYLVGKLADGNCWMLNNLKLGSFDNSIELTPANTNVTASWTLPPIDNTISSYDYTAPRLYALVTGQSGFNSSTPNSDEPDITNQNFVGYYYNWCAATAGLANTTCVPSSEEPPDATQDICPANWHMPAGGYNDDSHNEFSQLNAKMAGFANNQEPDYLSSYYNYYDNFQFDGPFRGVLSGGRSGSNWGEQGSFGDIWSTSHFFPDDSYTAFKLHFGSIDVDPDSYFDRSSGFSVRCLLR
jgi:uncharacterized protein (TIGR02145 family)